MNITLLTNPASDRAFRSSAEACLEKDVATPAALQQCLSADYPNVLVAAGILDNGSRRWYAYRDGRWTSSTAAAD